MHVEAQFETPGQAQDVAFGANHAYIADGTGGLQVVDIADPTSPQLVGGVDTPGEARGVDVVGKHAYLAARGGGLQIIDVTDPRAPVLLATVEMESAMDVVVSGDHAFVATERTGVQVVNVANPMSAHIVTSISNTSWAFALAGSGDFLYVAALTGFHVVDVSESSSPVVKSTLMGVYESVVVSGNHAYLASSDFDIVDISNPGSPTRLSSIRLADTAQGLAVRGSHVFVPTMFGLRSIDVSNPREPRFVGMVALDGQGKVAIRDGHAFVATQENVAVVDVASAVSPTEVGSSPTVGFAGDLAVSGNLACVADGPDGGLQIVDVSNPFAPNPLGGVDTPGTAQTVAVLDDFAFLADGGAGLQVIDFSTPSKPEIVATVGSSARDVAVSGGRAYVIVSFTQLDVVDISNPRRPNVVSTLLRDDTIAGHFFDWNNVAASGDYVYIGSHVDLTVVNVADPAAPTVTATIGWRDGAADFTVQGSYLYALDTHHHLIITDVSDPHNPWTVGSLNRVVLARDIAVRGDYAYVTGVEGRGLRVYDVSDPTSPRSAWGALLPDDGYGVAVAGEFVLVGAGSGGLQVFPAYCDEIVPVTLQDFVAEARSSGVEIRWSFDAHSDAVEFRLEATNGNDIWTVTNISRASRRFVAFDDVEFLTTGEIVTYTLYTREMEHEWTILGRIETRLAPAVLRTQLLQPLPNPFNPRTTIRYVLARPAHARLVIYALDGRRLTTLVDGLLPMGRGHVVWDGTNHTGRPLSSGVYVARLVSGGVSTSQKLVLLR